MPDHLPPDPAPRRATNVSLPAGLVALARELNVNISQACEAGLKAAVKTARETKFLEENRAAIEEYTKYVDEHGITLERYRTF